MSVSAEKGKSEPTALGGSSPKLLISLQWSLGISISSEEVGSHWGKYVTGASPLDYISSSSCPVSPIPKIPNVPVAIHLHRHDALPEPKRSSDGLNFEPWAKTRSSFLGYVFGYNHENFNNAGTFCLLPMLQSSKPHWGKHLAIHFCTTTVNSHIWNQCEYNSILSFSTPRKYYTMPNVVAHICNCGTQKVEAGESEIADQSMLDSFILSQKKTH